MRREFISISDSQNLEVVLEGELHSKALILHHGAFGSAENMAPIFREAASRGLCAIGITRPGYASSTRREGRRAVNYLLETQVVLNHFNITEFVSLGWSSGSPAAISDTQDARCKGVVTISGDAPRDSANWDSYIEKYPPQNPATEEPAFPSFDEIRTTGPDGLVKLFNHLLSQKDVEICQSKFGADLSHASQHGMSSGDFGALDDLESDGAPWGMDLSQVMQPVAVFQGDEDRMCVPAHGHFLAENLGNAELILAPGEGHISLMYNRASQIVDTAIELLNR